MAFTFADVSEDVVYELLKYLPAKDKVRYERVTTMFAIVANRQLMTQRAMAINIAPSLEVGGDKKEQQCGHKKHELDENTDIIQTTKLSTVLRKLADKCPNLEAIYLSRIMNVSALNRFTKLQHVAVANVYTYASLKKIMGPTLTCLEVHAYDTNETRLPNIGPCSTLTYFRYGPANFVFKKLADSNIVAFMDDVEHKPQLAQSASVFATVLEVYNQCHVKKMKARKSELEQALQRFRYRLNMIENLLF